jgi:Mn-dependent DtxR family transcriptional regulator
MTELSPAANRFIRCHVRSVWDIELLLLLLRDPSRFWTPGELVHELRASAPLVTTSLMALIRAGCVMAEEWERYRYRAAGPELEAQVQAVREAYANFPVAVTQLIWDGSHSRVKSSPTFSA